MIWLVLALLVLLSAMYSSSETALFKLDEAARAGAQPRVRRLLAEPRALLVTILLANLVVNLAFFALAPAMFGDLLSARGVEAGALAGGFLALVVLLVAGEIVPKALALRAPAAIAGVTAVPVAATIGLLGPLRSIVTGMLAFARTSRRGRAAEQGDAGGPLRGPDDEPRGGVLGAREADLLGEIVELEHLRVREAMTPRSISCCSTSMRTTRPRAGEGARRGPPRAHHLGPGRARRCGSGRRRGRIRSRSCTAIGPSKPS